MGVRHWLAAHTAWHRGDAVGGQRVLLAVSSVLHHGVSIVLLLLLLLLLTARIRGEIATAAGLDVRREKREREVQQSMVIPVFRLSV